MSARKPLYIDHVDADLILSALKFWRAQLSGGLPGDPHRIAGQFVSRRIDEIIEHINKLHKATP